MPYIVVFLIVICLLPLVPLFWYGIKEEHEKHTYQLVLACILTVLIMVVYDKILTHLIGLFQWMF